MVRLIVPDKVTALTASQAITAALFARERSGAGQHVRLSMLDAMLAFLWPEGMAAHTFVAEERGRERPRLAQDLVFETADGYVTVGAVSDDEWRGLARAAGHPEWIEDVRFATPAARIAHADERFALLAEVLRRGPSASWLERFEAENVPCAPVLRRRELADHPQVVANGIVVESEHPHVGTLREARPAARFDGTPAAIRRPAPALGEHTDEVLAESGYGEAEIAALRARGAVA
jgi:crotonobetainyl-CoA:carnitine CoA-transferase CaiB-like acyl-CoA transferase